MALRIHKPPCFPGSRTTRLEHASWRPRFFQLSGCGSSWLRPSIIGGGERCCTAFSCSLIRPADPLDWCPRGAFGCWASRQVVRGARWPVPGARHDRRFRRYLCRRLYPNHAYENRKNRRRRLYVCRKQHVLSSGEIRTEKRQSPRRRDKRIATYLCQVRYGGAINWILGN